MALTKKFLKELGLTDDDQCEAIMVEHANTLAAIKTERDRLRDDVAELSEVRQKLDEEKAKGADGWKDKYEKEHKAFEDFKTANAQEKSRAAKETAYRTMLKEIGVGDKWIDRAMKLSDIDGVELDDKGAIKDADKLKESAKTEWADCIEKGGSKAKIDTGGNLGGGNVPKTKDEIMKITDRAERRAAIAANMELFTGKDE